jgi:hypothetical protein
MPRKYRVCILKQIYNTVGLVLCRTLAVESDKELLVSRLQPTSN